MTDPVPTQQAGADAPVETVPGTQPTDGFVPAGDLPAVLEALLYLAEDALDAAALAEIVERDEAEVARALADLAVEFVATGRGVALREVAGGWRMSTAPVARAAVERFVLAGRSGRLTQAALETLAVVAYKQPIARADVSDIRGVNADGALRSLVSRGLVAEVGRADTPGQPILYGTTTLLLEKLGLKSLADLPALADHLPQAAPDEPRLDDLARARRLLSEGRDLPATGRASWDPDSPSTPTPDPRSSRADLEMDELSIRLEQAAKSASARLKQVVGATEEPEDLEDVDARPDDQPDDPADDQRDPTTDTPVDGEFVAGPATDAEDQT